MQREYALLARAYDRLWARYLSTSIERTLDRLELRGGERVLDIGCGTGLLLRALVERGRGLELHGVDLTPQMLHRARARLGDTAKLRVGYGNALPYPDGHFDVVISTSMLHCVPRPHTRLLAEWLRVSRPDAHVVVTDWRRESALTRVHTTALAAVGLRYHARTSAELRGLLDAGGLREVRADTYRAGTWGLTTVSGRVDGRPRRAS